ncbi:MAG: hypothetical protein MK212_12590 [Saprospiraceae bacterium]|nr:hypothetical protein [Saprospiraceae bacterium]
MSSRYHTICPLILLSMQYATEYWSGLYPVGMDWEKAVRLKNSEIDKTSTDYYQVSSAFTNPEQNAALINYKNQEFPAFDIQDLQEVDYSITQNEQQLFILRHCLENEETKIGLAQIMAIQNWADNFKLVLDAEDYILFDSATHYYELDLEEYPSITLKKGQYTVSTAQLIHEDYEIIIHKLELI